MKKVKIRWHSRAGQGAITASNALAQTLDEKFFTQSFADFGAEKRGAAIEVFTRISTQKIDAIHKIEKPDFIILFDESLQNPHELSRDEILRGANENTILIVNSSQKKTSFTNFAGKIFHCAADEISQKNISKKIPNVPLVAAFLQI